MPIRRRRSPPSGLPSVVTPSWPAPAESAWFPSRAPRVGLHDEPPARRDPEPGAIPQACRRSGAAFAEVARRHGDYALVSAAVSVSVEDGRIAEPDRSRQRRGSAHRATDAERSLWGRNAGEDVFGRRRRRSGTARSLGATFTPARTIAVTSCRAHSTMPCSRGLARRRVRLRSPGLVRFVSSQGVEAVTGRGRECGREGQGTGCPCCECG